MKKTTNILLMGCMVLLAVISCKRSTLDDLSPIEPEGKVISGDGIVIGDVVKDNEYVTVPFKIELSGPAKKAFQVSLTLNNDTVNQLIDNGTLENTILMPSGAVDYPSVINVKFGTDTATGVAVIRLGTLEKYYKKQLAFSLKLTNPDKSNTVSPTKSNILVVVNPQDLFPESAIHYLSFTHGGETPYYDVAYQGDYIVGLAGVTIPLNISLANQAAGAFDMKVKLHPDTIADLVANHILPDDAIQLDSGDFYLDTMVRMPSNQNLVAARLIIPWPVFDANIQANKRFAFYVTLEGNTKHVLDTVKSKMLIVVEPSVNLDNNSYITGNGTGLHAEYWTNTQFMGYSSANPASGEVRNPPFVSRIDENIDWGGGRPPAGRDWLPIMNDQGEKLSEDNFSTRWYGWFLAPLRGEYTFYQTRWDDGARLFINEVPIIDDFTTQWDKDSRNATIHLERGQFYKIEAHHRENVGGQNAHLEYEVKNANGDVIYARRIVQQAQLYPDKP